MSVEAEDISSILRNDSAPVEKTTDVEAEPSSAAPETEETKGPARGADGKFTKATEGEAKAEPEAAKVAEKQPEKEPPKAEKGQISALLAERGKRQQTEAELEKARARIAELEGGKEKPDFYTDPEKAVSELVNQRLTPIRQRFFDQSIKAASGAHEDFEAAAQHFSELIDKDPSLHARWMESEDPGEFAYEVGSNTPEFRKVQVTKHQEQLSALGEENTSLKARVAALEAQLAEAEKSKLESLPTNLNGRPTGQARATESDSDDIKSIARFGRRNN